MRHIAGSSRLLRAINETAALGLLLERGRLTRAELRELTGLAKPTTSEVLRRLQEAGLAQVVGRTSGGPGPNAEVYAVNPDAAYAAAISVRERHATQVPAPSMRHVRDSAAVLAAAVCDVTGETLATAEIEVDFAAADPVAAVTDAVRATCQRAGIGMRRIDYVHVGVPGSYEERSDTIRYVDVPGWSRPGLTGEIRRRLGTHVGVDNDVNLAATAERRHGVAAEHDGFALLWLGEQGLGLAIDLGGTLVRGARGGAGEIGYMPVGLPGRGRDGKPAGVHDFQDLVGGEAVRELGRQFGFVADSGHAAVALAVEALDADDPAKAHAFIEALAVRIAVGLAAVVAVLDPPLVVLAGEVGMAGGAAVQGAVASALRELSVLDTTVASSGLAEDPVLTGALDTALAEVRAILLGRRPERLTAP